MPKFLLLVLVFTAFTVKAQANKPVYHIAWKAALANDHFSNLTDEANLVKSSFGFRGELELLPTLTLLADFNLYWSTGRAQSWYGADGYSSGLNFNQAVLAFSPIETLHIEAGAISLSYLKSPLLVASGPFPGISVEFATENNNFLDLSLRALYSLPTSRSLNSDRIEKESEPSFIATTLRIATGKDFDVLGGEILTTYFKYDNLPSKVAYESGLKGNSVISNTSADSYFNFNYQGFSAMMGGFYGLGKDYRMSVYYTYLLNMDGPTVGNRGELLATKLDITLATGVLTPFFELFYNEADSSVAYYNSTLYGNNNRQGISLGVSYQYQQLFSVNFRYTNADLINVNNSISSRNQMIFFGLETNYIDIL